MALLGLLVSTAVGFADEKVVLRVPSLPNPSSTRPLDIAQQRVVRDFERRHPNVQLVAAEGLKIETVDPQATTVMMIAGGIAPDVIQMNFRSIDSFVHQGIVAPLNEWISAEARHGRNVLAEITPQIRPVIQRDGTGGNQVYAIPGSPVVMGLYFNRELFRLAGLPQRAPKDWEELVSFCRAIKAVGPRYQGILLPSGGDASWILMNFVWSAGAEAVQEVAPNEWRATFNSPEAVTAFEFYYKLAEADRLAIRAAGQISQQEREKIGMIFQYVGDGLGLDPELWGVGAVPLGPTGIRGSEINAPLYGIYSGVTDPKVKQAAWDYIAFVTGEEAERIKTNTFVEMGQAAQVSPVMLRKFGYEAYLSLIPEGFEEEVSKAVATGHPEPYGKNCNLVYNEMNSPLDQVLLSNEIRRLWKAGDQPGVQRCIKAILDRAVARTNERMIGYVSPEDMKIRRLVASILVVIIAVAFGWVFWYVGRIFNRNAATVSRPVAGRSLLPWFCLFPAVSLLLLWTYLPLARGTVMAFLDYQIILKSTFVGLDNFANVLFDRTFWKSILATFHFAAWTLTLGFATPLLLAYALHLIPRHKVLYRTLYYLPAVITGTAIFFLWRELFGMDGVLNQLLRLVGLPMQRAWPEDPNLAMLSCVIPHIWACAGPGCLIYLAALKTIPVEQFESAEIDGASLWNKTRLIVFPSLKALIFINFVGAVAGAFHGATNILVMTGGGPDGLTEVVSLLIFFEAFTGLRFGPAVAMAWILGSMLVGFTVLQLKRLSQMEFKTAR